MGTKNTITLEGNGIRKEKAAAAAFTPGHLLERTSADKFQKHSTAGGEVLPVLVAVEDDLQGNDIDDDYVAANQSVACVFRAGDRAYMWLKEGETAVIGSPLVSAGNGELQVHTPDNSSGTVTERSNAIVGIADEALDLSSSSGAEPTRRIAVEIV